MKIATVTPICEEDARWADQYLAEVERLDAHCIMFFDRCSQATVDRFTRSKSYADGYWQRDPKRGYRESDRQVPMDTAVKLGYDLSVMLDMDETLERDAPEKLRNLPDGDRWTVNWLNLWGDKDYVRVDKAGRGGNPWRVKIHRLQCGVEWYWKGPLVVDPYCQRTRPRPGKSMQLGGDVDVPSVDSGITCLHWGLMTRELREMHAARWDRVYGELTGKNPYSFWHDLLDEVRYPPTVERNVWL